jgi:hypothetical protein
MQTIKQFFNHEWVKNISYSVIAGFILLFVADWYNKTPLLSTFMMGINYVAALLTFQIPIYILFIAIVVIPLTWQYLTERKNRRLLDVDNGQYLTATHFKMLNYTADKFQHTVWKWDWKYNEFLKRYEVKSISPVCKNEGCQQIAMVSEGLNDEFGLYMWRCQDCLEITGSADSEHDIIDYVEKKDYSA